MIVVHPEHLAFAMAGMAFGLVAGLAIGSVIGLGVRTILSPPKNERGRDAF